MDVQYIFFDLGSTLVDETKAYEHRINDMIEGTDITFEQFREKRRFFAQQNMRGDMEAMKYFGLPYKPWHSEDEVLYPDTVEVLGYLHRKGYSMGVIANQPAGTVGRLEQRGLMGFFDSVAASAELGISKPDSRIFLKALEMAGGDAKHSVMIGDRLDNDIYPAMELGMKTIWIRQGFSVFQHLVQGRPHPDYIIESLSELRNIL